MRALPLLILCALWHWLISPAVAQDLLLRRVIDGDTCVLQRPGEAPFTVRIADIDAPELAQPVGPWARLMLERFLTASPLLLSGIDADRYGRVTATVSAGGIDVGAAMIATGAAWHYRTYSRRGELSGLEAQARAAKAGLWAQKSPLPPWEWRKRAVAGLRLL